MKRFNDLDCGGPYYARGMFDSMGKLTRFYKGNSSTQSNPYNDNSITDTRAGADNGGIAATSGASVTVNTSIQDSSPDVLRAAGDIVQNLAENQGEALAEVARSNRDAAIATTKAASDISYNNTQALKAAADAAASGAREANITARVAADAIQRAASDSSYATAEAAKASVAANQKVSSDALFANVDVSRAALSVTGDTIRQANDNAASLAKDVLDFRSEDTKLALTTFKELQQDANNLIRQTNEKFTSGLVQNNGPAATAVSDNIAKYVTIAAAVIGLGIAFSSSKKSA